MLHAPDQLLRHRQVAFRAHRLHIVQQDRLAKTGRLGEAHVARDRNSEHLRAEILLRLVSHLLREIEPRVVHREQHAVDRERGIEVPLHEFDGIEELRETLERVVLALDRNQHAVGRRQHVECEEAERGWTIDHHVLILLAEIPQGPSHHRLARLLVDELDLGTDQVLRGRDDVEVGKVHVGEPRIGEGTAIEQRVVQGVADAVALDADAARRVRLRISVDQQRLTLGGGERRGEVHCRRRLSDAALLVGDCDDARHL